MIAIIKEVIFSVLPLCFKRDRYISGKGRRNDDYDYYENFQTLSPTIILYVKLRGPLVPGGDYQFFDCHTFDENASIICIRINGHSSYKSLKNISTSLSSEVFIRINKRLVEIIVLTSDNINVMTST